MKTKIEKSYTNYVSSKKPVFALINEATNEEVYAFPTLKEAKEKQKQLAGRTVKDFNGSTIDIAAMQNSLRQFPSFCKKEIDDEGTPYLMNCVQRDSKCGCTIIGNGTLQFPLMIKHCKKHQSQKK